MHLNITDLKVEYLDNPLGIDESRPRFSWIIQSAVQGTRQKAYQIMVVTDRDKLDLIQEAVWNSGKVFSDQTSAVVYEGPALQSDRCYYWKVRVWDLNGRVSAWSYGYWSMGLLRRDEWKGQWIGLKSDLNPSLDKQKPSVYLRNTFRIDKPVKRAFLYVTALGLYIGYLNGRKIGESVLAPEWSDYKTRVYYQTHDVTESLQQGENCIGAIMGQGWYAGYIGLFGFQMYGKDPQILAQLNIEYVDGSKTYVCTNTDWEASFGPIVSSDLIMGEVYDARLEMPGWNEPLFDAGSWTEPDQFAAYKGWVDAQCSPPVKVMKTLKPKQVKQLGTNKFLIDMGQNLVGNIQLKIPAGTAAGDRITMRFAEALTPDGNLYQENLRKSKQTNVYISNGPQAQTSSTFFSIHGFQYIEIDGYPGELSPDALTAFVIHSGLDVAGNIETSDDNLNRLFHNIMWTQRGNFVSVPTDCPQRDERLGWMGDAQIFSITAAYNMDVSTFFSKWMKDVTDAQLVNGAFADFAPHFDRNYYSESQFTGASGWADAGIIIPWHMYQMYGDSRILRQHYTAMLQWMDHLERLHPLHIVNSGPQYGDWLSIPTTPLPDQQFGANISAYSSTPFPVFATAYYAFAARIMRDIAAVLGYAQDEKRFAVLHQQIATSFNREFVSEDGRIYGHTQTAYAMALFMELIPERLRMRAVQHLVNLIREQDDHLTTGIHGIRYLLPVLSDYGYDDVAYRLLLQDTYPSWMYTIHEGATTIWERWDGWTEDKGFQNPLMNSFNHYALGSVGEWMYRYMGGIEPAEPGYSKITIRPRVSDQVPKVDVRYRSIKGEIVSSWELSEQGELNMLVKIPANTTAEVYIPIRYGSVILEGGVPAEQCEGIALLEQKEGCAVYRCEPGTYRFTTGQSEE